MLDPAYPSLPRRTGGRVRRAASAAEKEDGVVVGTPCRVAVVVGHSCEPLRGSATRSTDFPGAIPLPLAARLSGVGNFDRHQATVTPPLMSTKPAARGAVEQPIVSLSAGHRP